jgi:2,4-dienoyl-CoA reductase-like NADH-dependent reductase (Old Yellow Enzyme family)
MLKFGTGVPMFDSEVSNFMKIEMTVPTATSQNFPSLSRADQPVNSPGLNAFACSRSLEMSLAEAPDVRADVVARGRALIADPNYPSKTQIKKIARTLVSSGLGR